MTGKFIAYAVLLAGGSMVCMGPSAHAGSSITPLAIHLATERAVGEVLFWNSGERATLVQASAALWSQANGDDQKADTHDLVIAPAIIEVPPKTGQVFRVRLRNAMPATETAYRLYLEDVTPVTQTVGVAYRLRHDLPVFVSPHAGKAQLSVNRCGGGAPAGCVQVDNHGSHFAKITAIRLSGNGWQRNVPTPGSVLAGSFKRWMANLPATATGSVRVAVSTSDGVLNAEWPVSER